MKYEAFVCVKPIGLAPVAILVFLVFVFFNILVRDVISTCSWTVYKVKKYVLSKSKAMGLSANRTRAIPPFSYGEKCVKVLEPELLDERNKSQCSATFERIPTRGRCNRADNKQALLSAAPKVPRDIPVGHIPLSESLAKTLNQTIS